MSIHTPDDTQIENMYLRITDGITREITAQKRRRVLAVSGTAVVLAGALTAAGIIATTAQQQNFFDCYSADTLKAPHSSVAFADEAQNSGLSTVERATLATQTCGVLWADAGTVSTTPTACLLPDLRIAVFPNANTRPAKDFCTTLGLTLPGEGSGS